LKDDLAVQPKGLQREIKDLTEEMKDKDNVEHENIELRDGLSIVSNKFDLVCAREVDLKSGHDETEKSLAMALQRLEDAESLNKGFAVKVEE
jgi:hypothetical protein